jgi:hypothetical protein
MMGNTVLLATADTLGICIRVPMVVCTFIFGTILSIKPIFQIKNGELSQYRDITEQTQGFGTNCWSPAGLGKLDKS